MRYLAIDIGRKRWGIALSDETRMIASAFKVIKAYDYDHLKNIIKENNVNKVIVGVPITLKNTESKQTLKVRKVIKKLTAILDVTVDTIDESLSTVEAEDVLINSGMSREDRKKVVDKVAAAYFLQSYLNIINEGS